MRCHGAWQGQCTQGGRRRDIAGKCIVRATWPSMDLPSMCTCAHVRVWSAKDSHAYLKRMPSAAAPLGSVYVVLPSLVLSCGWICALLYTQPTYRPLLRRLGPPPAAAADANLKRPSAAEIHLLRLQLARSRNKAHHGKRLRKGSGLLNCIRYSILQLPSSSRPSSAHLGIFFSG